MIHALHVGRQILRARGNRMTVPRATAIRAIAGTFLSLLLLSGDARAQSAQPDWKAAQQEAMEHFQALIRLDTSNPPGNETRAADYLKQVLEANGIPVQIF